MGKYKCCIVVLIGFCTLLETTFAGTFCYPDQKLTINEQGVEQCEDCEYCPSGEGVDPDEKVPVNKNGIPTECRRCKACRKGYWNNRLYGQLECMECRLNCQILNRKEYVPCGGSSPGRCGACINSDYVDKEQNIESPCVTKTTVASTRNTVQPLKDSETVLKVGHIAEEPIVKSSRETERTPDSTNIGQTVSLSIAGALFIALLVIARYIWKHRTRNGTATCSPTVGASGESVLSKDSSLLGADNYTTKHDLSKDDDLETDVLLIENETRPTHLTDLGPRPELPSNMPSSGPGAIERKIRQNIEIEYPKHLLKTDDAYVKFASKHIYDEGKYKPMFLELDLSEQDLHAEYNLFFHEKHKYDFMIGRLLNQWIKQAGNNATLDVLCKALDSHEFHKISIGLLNLYQNPSNKRTFAL